MSSKTRRDDEESANVSKPLNKKTFERQTDEINARFRKIEEEVVSLQASKYDTRGDNHGFAYRTDVAIITWLLIH